MKTVFRAFLGASFLLLTAGCGDNGLHPREHSDVSGFGPSYRDAGSYALARPLRVWNARYPAGTRLHFRSATDSVDGKLLSNELAMRLEKAEVPVGQSVIYLSEMHRGVEVPLTGTIRYQARQQPGGSIFRSVEGHVAQAITLGGFRYVAGDRITLSGQELPRPVQRPSSFGTPVRRYPWSGR